MADIEFNRNITLILVALIVGGALVGSALLIRAGAAELHQAIIMHGDSIKTGMGSLRQIQQRLR